MKNLKELLHKTIYILTPAQKKLSILVFILTCIGSLLECLGVSVIVPMVTVIQDADSVRNSKYLREISWVQTLTYEQIVFAIVVGVIFVYLFKNLYFVFLAWVRIKFSCKIQRETSVTIMTSLLSRGYQYFINVNYGEFARSVQGDATAIFNVINSIFRLISETFTITLICIFMFLTDWQLAISIVFLALLCLILIYSIFRKTIYNAGVIARDYSARTGQALSQTYYGAKDVILFKKQIFFIHEYETNTIENQKAVCTQNVISESPTYVIEGICVSGLMLAVGIKIVFMGAGAQFIAVLAAFAVGAFRILPCLSRISTSLNQMTAAIPQVNALHSSIVDAQKFIECHPEAQIVHDTGSNRIINKGGIVKLERKKSVISQGKFKEKLELKNIDFSYAEELSKVLNNITLTVNKGQAVAFIGESGAGKSTLIDVLLGLLLPQKGGILMDNKSIYSIPDEWADTIAYVPQTVFLIDDTIRKNVAFGELEEDIDDDLVNDALDKAKMLDFLSDLPEGIETKVGDRGVRLSGGQRQRIAIARALYHRPEILVLDEATSALDNDTEAAIMDAINSLHGQVTLIIVAHRLTTVRNCDVIYEVKNGEAILRDKSEIF